MNYLLQVPAVPQSLKTVIEDVTKTNGINDLAIVILVFIVLMIAGFAPSIFRWAKKHFSEIGILKFRKELEPFEKEKEIVPIDTKTAAHNALMAVTNVDLSRATVVREERAVLILFYKEAKKIDKEIDSLDGKLLKACRSIARSTLHHIISMLCNKLIDQLKLIPVAVVDTIKLSYNDVMESVMILVERNHFWEMPSTDFDKYSEASYDRALSIILDSVGRGEYSNEFRKALDACEKTLRITFREMMIEFRGKSILMNEQLIKLNQELEALERAFLQ